MIRLALLAALLVLAACGVDGKPTPPQDKPSGTGLTITGDARVGVTTTL